MHCQPPSAAVSRQASLRRLTIRDCDLTDLPPGAYMQQLEHLDLRGSLFRKVPAAVMTAPRLETLAIMGAR